MKKMIKCITKVLLVCIYVLVIAGCIYAKDYESLQGILALTCLSIPVYYVCTTEYEWWKKPE